MPNVIDIVVQASTGAASASLSSLNRGMHATGSGALAVGKAVGFGLAGIAGGAVLLGVKTAAANQQAEISFTSLLGSGEKAKTFLSGLTKFAADTPFDLPGVEKAAQQLLGVGMTSKQVVPFLTAFGNTASALGLQTDQFNSIMTQTTQAMAQGKFQIGDLNQLASNGVPIYKLLGEAFHTTQGHIIEMANAGQLTSAKVLPALQSQMNKDYGGSMAAQSKTLTGLWSTLQDTLSQSLAKAIQPLVPILGRVLPSAINAIGPVLLILGKALALVITLLSRVMPPAIQLVKEEFERIRPTLNNLVADFRTKVLPIIQEVIGKIEAHLPQMAAAFLLMWANVKPVLEMLVSDFQTKVMPVIRELISWVVAHLPQLGSAFLIMWANVKPTLMAFVGLLLTIYNSVLKPIVQWVIAHWPQIEVVMKIVFIAIAIAAKILLVALQVVFLAIAVAIRVLATVIGWLLNNVVVPTFRAISTVIRTEVSVWTAIIHGVMAVIRGIGSAFSDAYSAVSGWISKLVRLLSGLPGKVSSATSGLFNGIRDAFRDAINDVIDIWNRLHFHVPHIPGTSIGGDITVPQIGHMATGGIGGGLTEVGERGRELLNLPHGTHVRSNPDTERASAQRGGPAVVHLTLDSSGSPIDDFLMQLLRKSIRLRGGNVQAVLGPAG